MKERGLFRRAVSLLLASVCTVGCIGAAAHAEESAADTSSIINDKELTGIVESFMSERGISKNTLCKTLDIPRSNLNRYCRNEFERIDATFLCKLLYFFECSLEDLMTYDGNSYTD